MTLTIETLQPRLVALFQSVIARQQLSQGYLFSGDTGTGKSELATWVALRLFCTHVVDGMPDGTCSECQRILSGNHPDVVKVAPEGQSLKIEQIRFLKQELTKSGMETNQRVFIIQDADKMTVSAANGLLKFLEEPAPQTYLILTTTAKNQILPTIISRLQIIEFNRLPRPQFIAQLTAAGINTVDAALLARLTNSLPTAQEWLASDWFEPLRQKVWQWFGHVQENNPLAFVDVQANLVPVAKERAIQNEVLALILLLLQDVLALHFGRDTELSFPGQRTQLSKWAENVTNQQLLTQMEAALAAQKYLTANVSFQNTLERLTLQLLK
ncbi:DNA polymerase III subunit delta' [Loigolactobacillus coryniformis]|uniref:DNA polymerase III subunit delta' n=1 Tax=Loigolactobacillus coryniformis subsp. torquens DSM 20004 = KCTC 3535 TaxID=1423822 RepID=A0A2D1KMW3_9LACO|nr:DNA polymerase III subunit delta' [Loigolactobacillus coryniformis]ATO43436.1 DNA polymerase III subunit delta' [Loigolactobacillus coryniformis subsp. torquens DSM 20004 = KCTC 3535]KRK85541.1 DNA polymerase III delta subunit [Loigolactobacillus coryniformis subsp. torquens DSM 20004 = KCTC 3535]